jgi:hypothetical protein
MYLQTRETVWLDQLTVKIFSMSSTQGGVFHLGQPSQTWEIRMLRR